MCAGLPYAKFFFNQFVQNRKFNNRFLLITVSCWNNAEEHSDALTSFKNLNLTAFCSSTEWSGFEICCCA